jgi:hypothetical protein
VPGLGKIKTHGERRAPGESINGNWWLLLPLTAVESAVGPDLRLRHFRNIPMKP